MTKKETDSGRKNKKEKKRLLGRRKGILPFKKGESHAVKKGRLHAIRGSFREERKEVSRKKKKRGTEEKVSTKMERRWEERVYVGLDRVDQMLL